MLEELRVHGVGGIRNAELTFADGFNVITGESGAGKSSLVRALEFISGKRAQTSLFDDAAGQADDEAEQISGGAHVIPFGGAAREASSPRRQRCP